MVALGNYLSCVTSAMVGLGNYVIYITSAMVGLGNCVIYVTSAISYFRCFIFVIFNISKCRNVILYLFSRFTMSKCHFATYVRHSCLWKCHFTMRFWHVSCFSRALFVFLKDFRKLQKMLIANGRCRHSQNWIVILRHVLEVEFTKLCTCAAKKPGEEERHSQEWQTTSSIFALEPIC